jgi:hypothetical protein
MVDQLPDVGDGYSKRFVAFVDILGFANLVRSADAKPQLRSEIIEALRKVRRQPNLSAETDLRVQNFSDSLILSSAHSADGLWGLLLTLDALAWNLLQMSVLIRGAVALGGIYQDDEIVFGLGVNEAYRLESTVAKYPRLILSGAVKQAADHYAPQHATWDAYRNSRLLRDFDGVTFLHILNDVAAANLHPRPKPPEIDAWGEAGRQVQAIIQRKLDETLDAPDVYDKVSWLGRYWNDTVVRNTVNFADAAFGPVILAGQQPRSPTLPFRHRP